jgi:hypothetical protein
MTTAAKITPDLASGKPHIALESCPLHPLLLLPLCMRLPPCPRPLPRPPAPQLLPTALIPLQKALRALLPLLLPLGLETPPQSLPPLRVAALF